MTELDQTPESRAEPQSSARSSPAPIIASSAANQPPAAATTVTHSSPSYPTSIPSPHPSSSSAAAPLRHPAAAVAGDPATVKAGGHPHTLSFSPRPNQAFSDPDYYPDREDADDVFSNPDTAELEARSDATGSTSPDRAMSPVLSSPDSRGRSGFTYSPPEDLQVEDAVKATDRLSVAAALHHRPSHESQMTQNTATPVLDDGTRGWASDTITPTTSYIGGARSPSLGSSPTARRASMHPRPVSAHQALLFSDSNATTLPAANDLPTDPSEASSVATLFAHPPGPSLPSSSQGSPALSAIRLALSTSPTFSASPGTGASKSASAAGSPMYERPGYLWSAAGDNWATQSPLSRSSSRGPLAAAAPGGSGTRTTPTTRPSSPDRSKTIMPPLVIPEHTSTPVKATSGSFKSRAGGPCESSSSPISSCSPVSGGASSRSFGGAGLGLGLPSPAGHSLRNTRGSVDVSTADGTRHVSSGFEGVYSATPMTASDSSIFERDIEHRDARHVLSKSEAVDVAIPPVLDDAVEAIIEGGDQPLEILAPLPSVSTTPHALSALALSAHSLASSTSSGGLGANSAMIGTSSPRSVQGGPSAMTAEEPPLGSVAAQIAERMGAPRGHAGDDAPPSAAATAGDHFIERRSRGVYSPSSGASSVSDTGKSRSPGPNAASVQQVLEGALPGSPLAGRSFYVRTTRDRSPAPQSIAQSKSVLSAHTAATGSHSRAGSLSQQGTPAAIGTAATALPSLPLPNPFRPESPAVAKHAQQPSSGSALGFIDGGNAPPPPVTMSLDGAIIPSSESAIHEMSLDAMADALADTNSDAEASPSPIVARKVSVVASSPQAPPSLAFLRRDTNATITATNIGSHSEDATSAGGPSGVPGADDLDMPGGFPGDSNSVFAPTPTKPTSSPETRRLSFFSYADIINDTPAELVDFEEVVSREMASGFVEDAHLPSGGGGGSKIARSPRASFGGAGLAKPFSAPAETTGTGVGQ